MYKEEELLQLSVEGLDLKDGTSVVEKHKRDSFEMEELHSIPAQKKMA